jgi:hypothetical protein
MEEPSGQFLGTRKLVIMEEPSQLLLAQCDHELELPEAQADPETQLQPQPEPHLQPPPPMQPAAPADSAFELPTVDTASLMPGMPNLPVVHQASLRRTLSSYGSQRPARPAAINEALLRLLAEAYGRMVEAGGAAEASGATAAAAMTDEEIESWLRRLLELSAQPGSNTVAALHSSMRSAHYWLRLSDVYSALLYLRQKYGVVAEEG